MEMIKLYLMSRLTSLPAWIGMVCIPLEFVLHAGDTSVVLMALYAALIFFPESDIRAQMEKAAVVVKNKVDDM